MSKQLSLFPAMTAHFVVLGGWIQKPVSRNMFQFVSFAQTSLAIARHSWCWLSRVDKLQYDILCLQRVSELNLI